jgi:hypothetical protein
METFYGAVAAMAMGSPFLAIFLILAYYYLLRVPWLRNRKTGRRKSMFSMPSTGLGTVVIGLTLIYRPRIEYAIEAQQRQVEDADEDDNGDPDTPARHLLRQLRRIRRGEKVDRLTLKLE